ncbi:MAG: hypothetical protein FWD68_03125 [Alphaproteobacteria bacterium]|nr:hypothetical protein [Alphaproteobacteria bacterium]
MTVDVIVPAHSAWTAARQLKSGGLQMMEVGDHGREVEGPEFTCIVKKPSVTGRWLSIKRLPVGHFFIDLLLLATGVVVQIVNRKQPSAADVTGIGMFGS